MVRDQMSGSRELLLALLREHLLRAADAHELEMTQRTIEFIGQYANCAERSLTIGHLTGSSWIVDTPRRRTLLTHHRKLEKWLQLGGHADGDLDLAAVAVREAREESGLDEVALVSPAIFDVDCHWIPERKNEVGHWHYDLRFLARADSSATLVISHESRDLAWVELAKVPALTSEESILRMVRKTMPLPNRAD